MNLKKGMSKNQIDNWLQKNGYNISLYDEHYLGNNCSHNWICHCGEVIERRSFSKIKERNSILCKKCVYQITEERYKNIIEDTPGYEYIKSYRSGDIIKKGSKTILVKDSPYIEIKHIPCERVYTITFGGFQQGKRCTCSPFEKSIEFLYPNISKLIYSDCNGNIINDKLKKTIHAYSSQKFYFKCDKCHEISDKPIALSQIVSSEHYSCKYCSDGISLPEKFVISLLTFLDIKFQLHKSFKWSNKRIYDFYIPNLKLIIETHGIQHYEESPLTNRRLEEEQANDKLKKDLALNHINHYLVINCKNSSFNWLREHCINELSYFFDLSNVNWSIVWENSQKSYIKESWTLWYNGLSLKEISNVLKLSTNCIRKYLYAGVEINKCNYSGDLEKERKKRKVICLNTNIIYNSISDAAKENNLTLKTLHRCCNSKFKRLGKFDLNEDLIWMYLDEYNSSSMEYIKELKNSTPPKKRKVECLTTGKQFDGPRQAGEYYNCERRNILSCCYGERNYCGKLEDGTHLKWHFI